MIFLILTEMYNACKCVPLNLDHSKTEFFITFISYPHTKLIINYHFCKIQSGHPYSSPAMIFLILTETYNACKCVPLNLDHSKTEFFITFISYPHTKLIINYHFCKIQSGHSYSSPAMISFNITRNVQCLRLCEAGFKIEKLFCVKLSLYICLQYTLHTCSYVCTSRESLNVSSELCNMCLHFSKPPLVKASCLLFYSNYVLVYMYMTLLDMCRGISFGFV